MLINPINFKGVTSRAINRHQDMTYKKELSSKNFEENEIYIDQIEEAVQKEIEKTKSHKSYLVDIYSNNKTNEAGKEFSVWRVKPNIKHQRDFYSLLAALQYANTLTNNTEQNPDIIDFNEEMIKSAFDEYEPRYDLIY